MLTIGDFSRLSRVTPRMLRHYDALGLLRPATVGENGYRYYGQAQLADLARIQWLQGYGFTLAEIGPLLALDDARLVRQLRARRLALYQELDRQQARIHRLEADILRMEGTTMIETPYQVILLENPAQKVFSIRETLGVEQFHQLFLRLRHEAAARGLTQDGPIQVRYHDRDFDPARADVEAQMVVAQDGPGVTLQPACLCAAVQHRGPYENLHLAYEALCAWLGAHTEYRICAPAIERYLNDPHNTTPDQLATGVMFPVDRV